MPVDLCTFRLCAGHSERTHKKVKSPDSAENLIALRCRLFGRFNAISILFMPLRILCRFFRQGPDQHKIECTALVSVEVKLKRHSPLASTTSPSASWPRCSTAGSGTPARTAAAGSEARPCHTGNVTKATVSCISPSNHGTSK
jgi:hypothetical protein